MNWLLVFVPLAIGLEVLAPERHLLIFVTSSLALLPRAAWMGQATEQLAERMGEGVGGLLNATFGNAAELIIALAALRAGLSDVVKASVAGSIIGNILLVLGAAMLTGGLRRTEQQFNSVGARSQATMLTLAAIALILPAAFQSVAGTSTTALVQLSASISIVLLLVYLLFLAFSLITHSSLFAGSYVPEKQRPHASAVRAALTLDLEDLTANPLVRDGVLGLTAIADEFHSVRRGGQTARNERKTLSFQRHDYHRRDRDRDERDDGDEARRQRRF